MKKALLIDSRKWFYFDFFFAFTIIYFFSFLRNLSFIPILLVAIFFIVYLHLKAFSLILFFL